MYLFDSVHDINLFNVLFQILISFQEDVFFSLISMIIEKVMNYSVVIIIKLFKSHHTKVLFVEFHQLIVTQSYSWKSELIICKMQSSYFLQWLHGKIHNYNLFVPDENDYDDDDDETQDPSIIVKQQKYATRLYIPLFISKYIISQNRNLLEIRLNFSYYLHSLLCGFDESKKSTNYNF